jgi:hypothetical protein
MVFEGVESFFRKLIVAQMIKRCSTVYGTQRLISVFATLPPPSRQDTFPSQLRPLGELEVVGRIMKTLSVSSPR